ncbi:MAG: NAD(P)H-hydrate dehydratase [Oscillospiraceae bacterium]|nr:NAD(P)H-hydrate dehydratase [Oscillospiraceae bacterium]
MNALVQSYHEMDERAVSQFLPKRGEETHKGDYGKILMLCGSTGFTGAACLAAKAAMRTGTGLCYLGVPEQIYPIVAAHLFEPVVFPLPCDQEGRLSFSAIPEIERRLADIDAVLAGPGLGQSDAVLSVVRTVVLESRVPVVLDADGINVLREHMDVLRKKTCPVILTPHDGEFCRLYDGAPAGRYQETRTLARETGCIVLRKGHRTLISDGSKTYRNKTGNPGMAKGGSGDVLSGMILSLLGQGMPPLQAAALGAWLHGAAGDLAARRHGEYGVLPSDLIATIPYLIQT